MSSTPPGTADLSAPKRELLALLLARNLNSSSPSAQPPSQHSDADALSFSQERLWFLAQLDPGLPAYNAARAWRLHGRVNHAALEQSLTTIVQRHRILGARFPTIEGRPVQRVRQLERLDSLTPLVETATLVDAPTPIDGRHDRGVANGDHPDARVVRFVAETSSQPFDLAEGPLFRASLLMLGERDHVLLIATHHIVFDGWSATILIRELGALYNAIVEGRTPTLPHLSSQYADFVRWQRERFASDESPRLAAYWKAQLAGIPALTSLPIDNPRPARMSSRGGRHTTTVPPPLVDDLKTLSRRHGATLFMTLLAAFTALLHRYTDEQDIIVGSPIANRSHAAFEGVIGRFANILPMRVRLNGDPSLVELLSRVKEAALGAYAHQDMPFEKLVDTLRPPRALGYSPIFQVGFGLQSPSMLTLSGLTATPLDTFNGHVKFDLNLSIIESAGQLAVAFEFRLDLFNASTIASIARDFHRVLEATARDADQRLSALAFSTDIRDRHLALRRTGPVRSGEIERAQPPVGDALELELIGIWEHALGTRPIRATDNFFDIGGTSFLAVLLVMTIQERYGIALTPDVLFEAPTVAKLARVLREKRLPSWSTVVAVQPRGDLPPLFCVHGAGGNVVGYADLARHLGARQPVYGVQAIGLDGKHAPQTDLQDMAKRYVSEIRTFQPDGPYYLSGLSMGGVVAFEMARVLHQQGQQVGLLALFDTSRPGHLTELAKRLQVANYGRRLRYHAGQLLWGPGRRGYLSRKLTTAKRRIRERTWHLAYLPYRVSGRVLPRVLHHVRRANRVAIREYKPLPFAGRVTLFVATERAIDLHRASDLGWGEYALGGVEIHEVPGDHVNLIAEPAVGRLAERLRECLDRARRSCSTTDPNAPGHSLAAQVTHANVGTTITD